MILKMKKKIFYLLGVLPLILLSIMLINKNTNHHFKLPNEIVIYEHGTERKISKENLLYSKILTYTNERFETNLDMYKLSIAKDEMKKFKKDEVILEFIYTNKKKSTYRGYVKEYYKLIMPLTGEYKDMVFFDTNKNDYNSPIGKLNEPDKLLELFNQ
jgi:hypothetical protein